LPPAPHLVPSTLETSAPEDRRTLGEVLAAGLGLLAPRHDVDEQRLLALVTLHHERAVDRQTEVGDRGAGRRVPKIGIAREVADEENLVERGHGHSLVRVELPAQMRRITLVSRWTSR